MLLAQKAIIQASPRHQEIKKSTKAIIFLGCPHNGSNFAKLGVLAAQILYPLGSNPGMLQGLVYDSQSLSDLHETFVESIPDIKVVNFYEERGVCILKLGWFRWEKQVSRYESRVQLIVLTIPSRAVCHAKIGYMGGRPHRRKLRFKCRPLRS
jgi:hypothetical protein